MKSVLTISLLVFVFSPLAACGGGGGGDVPMVASSSSSLSSSVSSSSSNSSTSSSSSASSSSASSSSSSASSSSTLSSSSSVSSSSSSSSSSTTSLSISKFIVVDQFGYLPTAQKIAVIRDPQTGYDAVQSYTPGANLTLVNMNTNAVVLTTAPVSWNSGATDSSSGDKAWWFDFSSVTTPGTYAVVDATNNARSPSFKIDANVYQPVLKTAMRSFFYQRAGFAKQLPYADVGWTDAASHIGTGQDTQARIYNDKNNAATAKDVSGGWYDAGDYNKYTAWTASYVITLLQAYIEHPAAWTDDFNIPESGNGIPDILDEVKWGLDWLKKMQDATGNNSVLCIVGLAGGSPPSSVTGPSYYGPATTNATMATAGAFALASKVFADFPSMSSYANDLKARAINAWMWAVANPNVTFKNNDSASNSGGLGAGQQEPLDGSGNPDATQRATTKRISAVYLYAATNDTQYKTYLEANYTSADLMSFADPFREYENSSLLYYTSLIGVTGSVATNIKTKFTNAMNSGSNWNAMVNKSDPYLAYIDVYTWGSNHTKSDKGAMFMDTSQYGLSAFNTTQARNYALTYVNYIHGVNPQGMVYLSNMYSLGAYNSVNEFFHSWFADGSALWDRVGTSTYGPAPGFLVGGPNPSYDWDGQCPGVSGCGSAAPSPPKGQPAQKSYKDFNTSWPLNSWSVTENSCGYQSSYLRLLSKFVN